MRWPSARLSATGSMFLAMVRVRHEGRGCVAALGLCVSLCVCARISLTLNVCVLLCSHGFAVFAPLHFAGACIDFWINTSGSITMSLVREDTFICIGAKCVSSPFCLFLFFPTR